MLKRKNLLIGIVILLIVISFMPSVANENIEPNSHCLPQSSTLLKDSANILITSIDREAEISGFGLLTVRDHFTVKNENDYPIYHVLMGIPDNLSDHLIFYEAKTEGETNLIERRSLTMENYEMILIYFSSPILPKSSKNVEFVQVYKDAMQIGYTDRQLYKYSGTVYPIFPYKAEGTIKAAFNIPTTSSALETDWGAPSPEDNKKILYSFNDLKKLIDIDAIEPLATNLQGKEIMSLIFSDNSKTKLEILELDRVIDILPSGVIKVKESYVMQNLGYVPITTFSLNIPGPSKMVNVYDDLGEILGLSFSPIQNYTHLDYRTLTINLAINRVQLIPGSRVAFTVEYHLIFDKFSSVDWFRLSVQFDAFMTSSEFLIRDLSTTINARGSFSINSITHEPDSIKRSLDSTQLIYSDEYITPLDKKEFQLTFTINAFEMNLRPLVFIILLAIISSAYVLYIKTREEQDIGLITREYVPVNEIREFCALFEEKNALFLEMKAAEQNAKRKKIGKKQFRNLLSKNNAKIEEINEEIKPFREVLTEANPVFNNIISKLEVFEAERISVEDSIKLLETRYRRGKLPSAAAYKKLVDNFSRRSQKIDRSIDKLIQHLRSYLL